MMSDGQTARQMHSFVSACHKPSLVGSMTLDIVIFLRIQVHEKGLEVSTPGYYLQVLGATFGRMQLIKMLLEWIWTPKGSPERSLTPVTCVQLIVAG
ncbi:hypothetical protein JOB18_019526 [Solea senegalensis]|uniref:Uncharacterized protein n=1 Tax=Solea senegalensis TaxID=28829 RepID=A0AAV6SCX8_SOLSE|nr:hypothetical protein JOB18_019526 [Solea senegalensis]